jgi:hypothetical protein
VNALSTFASRVARVARNPPGYVFRRLLREARMESDRVFAPLAVRRRTPAWLLRAAKVNDIDELWKRLAERPYYCARAEFDAAAFSEMFPNARAALLKAADQALSREVDLLGSGPKILGTPIDWLRDIRTGDRWDPAFCRSIDYVNRGRPSDVKIPWEISRLQWLMPAGQAYRLTGDERYAIAARDFLEEWIAGNPYAWTVNWSCTMEPALRLFSWTWLFHQFARSPNWADPGFRGRFLSSLYLHGEFVDKHIERSIINGNHLTADAAGLVIVGLFFGDIDEAPSWAERGWDELTREIALQVHPDGVDFEASVPYHRLVCELFLLPARYRHVFGMSVPPSYQGRLAAMAKFIAGYTRPDGSSPCWGDADDGRALPLGTQPLADHRYLIGLIALTFADAKLATLPWGEGDEIAWHCGTSALPQQGAVQPTASVEFPDGGLYVLRNANSHVFIDCGPIGLAGLGGHGHNDALSFEAYLDGVLVITDPGSYVYTASFEDRNAFRATISHNTPQVDGEEINRFISPDNLWNLHDDAKPQLIAFEPKSGGGRFVGSHYGYSRLAQPAYVKREIDLFDARLTITDTISGDGIHEIAVPLHFAAGVEVSPQQAGCWVAKTATKSFQLRAMASAAFKAAVEATRASPSYGVAVATQRLVLKVKAQLPVQITITLAPQ